jgi:hypothetical protein
MHLLSIEMNKAQKMETVHDFHLADVPCLISTMTSLSISFHHNKNQKTALSGQDTSPLPAQPQLNPLHSERASS